MGIPTGPIRVILSAARLGDGEVVMRGRVIAGRYRLVAPVGEGGMGSVWRAERVELASMSVAIKLMLPELAANPEGLARFWREAEAATLLRSPHLVQIYDFGVDQGTPYIVMELLRGGEVLSERLKRVGRLSLGDAAAILMQVARGVGKAHDAGIVHRDLKPGNIYVEPDEDHELVKVFDFGIAKRMDGTGVGANDPKTQSGSVLGTPYYMSPEQAMGQRTIDHRTDVWAMGVIAFQCVTGRTPFDGDCVGALAVAVCTGAIPVPSAFVAGPRAFDEWFLRAVARDPNARFQSMREAARGLATVAQVAESGVVARPSAPPAEALPEHLAPHLAPAHLAPAHLAPVYAVPVPAAPVRVTPVPLVPGPVTPNSDLSERGGAPPPLAQRFAESRPDSLFGAVSAPRAGVPVGVMAMNAGSLIGWGFFALVVVVTPHAAAQSAAPPTGEAAEAAAAATAADTGRYAYERGNYRVAAEELGIAYRIRKLPTMGLWYARALGKLAKLTEAVAVYEEVLAFETSALPVEKRAVQQAAQDEARPELAALSAELAVLAIELDRGLAGGAEPVVVSVDGRVVDADSWASFRVNPGEHRVRARQGSAVLAVQARSGVQTSDGQRFSVRPREQWTLTIAVPAAPEPTPKTARPTGAEAPTVGAEPGATRGDEPPARSHPQRLAAYGAFAVGAAGVVAYAVSGAYGLGEKQSIDDRYGCTGTGSRQSCDVGDDDPFAAYERARAVNIAGLVVGLLGAGAGATLLLTEPQDERGAVAARVGRGTLALEGRF
ncbi:MAG: protein kinase [Polyangiaceae bacterium]|nr:protein kinase [Polyangiaceae bacterium]